MGSPRSGLMHKVLCKISLRLAHNYRIYSFGVIPVFKHTCKLQVWNLPSTYPILLAQCHAAPRNICALHFTISVCFSQRLAPIQVALGQVLFSSLVEDPKSPLKSEKGPRTFVKSPNVAEQLACFIKKMLKKGSFAEKRWLSDRKSNIKELFAET